MDLTAFTTELIVYKNDSSCSTIEQLPQLVGKGDKQHLTEVVKSHMLAKYPQEWSAQSEMHSRVHSN